MSGASVTVDDGELRKLLNRLQRKLGDMSPIMDEIGATVADNVRLGFNDGRDPWGHSWAPLSPVTIYRRRKKSSRPLRDTGRLMNSITHKAGRDYAVVGTNVEYAGTHQFGVRKGQFGKTRRGAPIPWGRIPARPFLPLRDGVAAIPREWSDEIIGILNRHIGESL